MWLSGRWDKEPCTNEAGLTPDDIAGMQDVAIANAVAYCYEKSPFYRRRFDDLGLRPSDVTSARALERIPFTSKQDVSQGGAAFWCSSRDKIVDIVTTSGTTGEPTLYPMTEEDVRRLGYNEHLSFLCAGLTPSDTVLLAVTMDKCFMAGLAYFEGLRRIGAATVRIGSGSVIMLLSMLDRVRPTVIVSVPSFLRRIAAYAQEKGVDLAAGPVRKLVCIGEPVRNADFSLNALGERLHEAWGTPPLSTYGVTELAVSMCECENGCGGHVHPELVYIEIIDENGRRVEEDFKEGEIVATSLGVDGMPLLRFRTGDWSFLVRQPCACGSWTPRIGPILGRRNQVMKIKGTSVYPSAVQKVLDGIDEVAEYVMIATSSAALSDDLEIVIALRAPVPPRAPGTATARAVAGCGAGEHLLSIIREQLQGELKVTPVVRIAGQTEVEVLQGQDGSRKKRVFIDRRTSEGLPSVAVTEGLP